MIKKYPFSTRVAKAMMAATIALTPIVTTAGVFGTEQAEAAYVQIKDHFKDIPAFEEYAKSIKNLAKGDSDSADEAVYMKLSSKIDSADWNTLLAPVLQGNDQAKKDAVIKLLELQVKIYTGSYNEGELQTFIDEYGDVFGTQSAADYLQYLELVEAALYEEVSDNLASFNSDPTYALVSGLIDAVKGVEYKGIDNIVADVLVVTDPAVKETAGNLKSAFLTEDFTVDELKLAVMNAGLAWMSLYGKEVSSGGGGGSIPNPDPDPVPDDDGEVDSPSTPGAQVEVTPAIVTSNTGAVTATIPQSLQAQIMSHVTVQTPEVKITLPAVAQGQAATLSIPGSLAASVKSAAPNAAITVTGPAGVNYVIPINKMNLGSISAGSLKITIKPATPSERSALVSKVTAKLKGTSAASSETKAAVLVGNVTMPAPAVTVELEAVVGSQTIPLTTFGDIYVQREFPLSGTIDTNRTTGVTITSDGTVKALPTTFKTEDGQQKAVVSSLFNSDDTYTVLQSNVTFPDVNNGTNWAEKYIESLASKFIVSGTTAGTYKPDQDMTRSQFVFLLSRALGLPDTTAYDKRFSDVKGDEWFNTNGEFMAAVKYGVVAGKPNGTFAPNDKVTRVEAAAMIGRAMELGFISFDDSELDSTKKLSSFKDVKEIGASTRAEVLKVYQAGIMSGASNGEFNPNEYTKRDQMARILAEFLMKADLMEDIK
ncbi:S-layer homology domain-containing protein [Domibacillus sp. DTU_2020_1001157_1_SI_ALB_TIR_016]|uniref:S-layer homology domain-containing protein n=1 Tax=Domibacillus sp. DTU_2020_1001157_1_SI_ALB_TIR_016 TaxID=3077789 RepID=UPI0028E68387|nr:S-layer homology domain-containing protein [Domibacillus sp. DTU_2020_1001157_1_SI_ALB_TIR_016]WNS81171.1 S-layer homology domain-containing protein [Domibacillus sp. DTU_2020_1001157_1_SI_ALB_TIR_016]